MFVGRNADAVAANFTNIWTPVVVSPIKSDLSFIAIVVRGRGRARDVDCSLCSAGRLALSVRRVEQRTFTAGEVKDPRRNLPLSLAFGTGLVITLYLLANVAYLCVLPSGKNSARGRRPRRHGRDGGDVRRRGRSDHGGRHHDLDLWLL